MSHSISDQNVRLKRAYEPPAKADGQRILVDRLWPRGVRKSDAKFDEWAKEIAPSAQLRNWFGHDPTRWKEFCRRYRAELAEQAVKITELRRRARSGPITLVYGARDETHNDAIVLRDVLLDRASQ